MGTTFLQRRAMSPSDGYSFCKNMLVVLAEDDRCNSVLWFLQ